MAKGKGNDFFLHWTSNCKDHDKEHLQYSFPEGRSEFIDKIPYKVIIKKKKCQAGILV
jgi:hypothetical protein